MENQISKNFYIFDGFAEKEFPYQKRNNVCANRSSKIEPPTPPASNKQSNEIHRNLLVDRSTTTSRLQLVHRCKFHTLYIHIGLHIYSFIRSFIYSFNQSFIHSKINYEGQEHLICCKVIG